MTEYDYSPEGYQRYLETQERISRWVDTAEAHRHQFQAPFGTRSDAGKSEQWDGVSRTSRRNEDYRDTTARGPPPPPPPPPPPSQAPPPPLYHPKPVPAAGVAPALTETWYQTRGDPTTVQYQQQPPAFIITQQSKRKSSKSHKSHKSSSRSRSGPTYIIHTPGIPPPPTITTVPQPPPGQYGPPSSTSAVTYITTDHTGYPVTHTVPLHQVPGSVYSYSTPPAAASSPPIYSNPPPPMMSPYTSPPTSPPLPGSPYHQPQPSIVILPPNTRTVKVMY